MSLSSTTTTMGSVLTFLRTIAIATLYPGSNSADASGAKDTHAPGSNIRQSKIVAHTRIVHLHTETPNKLARTQTQSAVPRDELSPQQVLRLVIPPHPYLLAQTGPSRTSQSTETRSKPTRPPVPLIVKTSLFQFIASARNFQKSLLQWFQRKTSEFEVIQVLNDMEHVFRLMLEVFRGQGVDLSELNSSIDELWETLGVMRAKSNHKKSLLSTVNTIMTKTLVVLTMKCVEIKVVHNRKYASVVKHEVRASGTKS
ncbi:unnamed protein product [Rhizoctonia solani]|uniref:Aip3p/Bud6 N-terminal domain-containing protein n=1 Tax=Rhizoctonia solani TaxID=456999 RepID=A0A8H2WLT8_9AGAM|nr:unnamed protein product [Rhizoctonia solani]